MKSIFTSIFVIFLTTITIFAEPPFKHGTITGVVRDGETEAPIAGANVMIANSSIGTATRIDGTFVIDHIPSGEIDITISMMGYKKENRPTTVKPDINNHIEVELEKTLLKMGSVVVTGSGTPHTLEEAPLKTKLISRLDIEQGKFSNVAEALSFQPGINVENNCQNCNFTQVKILGMDGKYSQILIDGDPVVSSLAGVYGLEHFPSEMLDRMEIVKGGGSALYGAGAVAGVINLVTRRPEVNQSRIKYRQTVMEQGTNDFHIGISSEMINHTGNSGAYLFASTRHRDYYDRNGDGYSELGQLKNESLGFNWFYAPVRTGELSVHFHRIHEFRRGGNDFDLPNHEANVAESVEHWKWGGTLKWNHRISTLLDYNIFYSLAVTNRESYYGGTGPENDEDRETALLAYGTTENPMQIAGLDMNYKMGRHLFTTGIQFSSDKLLDRSAFSSDLYIDENYKNIGFILQDDLHLGSKEQLEIIFGARLDKHSEISEMIISPRTNLKYILSDNYVLRAGFSTGFKAPQTFDEDLHILGLEGKQKILRNDDGLSAEKSQSLTLGLDYNGYLKNIGIIFGITGYHTRIKDAFAIEFDHYGTEADYWKRINSDGLSLNGVELEAGIQPNTALEVLAGLTFLSGKYDSDLEDWHTRNFLRTPEISATLGILASLTRNTSINLKSKYMGRAQVPHEGKMELIKSDDFLITDILINYQIPMIRDFNIKSTLGIRNAFDAYQADIGVGADRDPGYVYGPSLPRSFFINFETSF
ncbi:MAG: TonB-dependent receptor [Fidelibacterota bacterium]